MPDGFDINGVLENPQYQRAVQRIQQIPPYIKALSVTAPADSAAANELAQRNTLLMKAGVARQALQNKVDLAEQGLGVAKSYYDLRNTINQNTLDLNKAQNLGGTVLGLANAGVAAYGLGNARKYNDMLDAQVLKMMATR